MRGRGEEVRERGGRGGEGEGRSYIKSYRDKLPRELEISYLESYQDKLSRELSR